MLYAPLTIIIADDSDAYRSGIARAIEAHEGLELIGEAVEGEGALAAIEALMPDIALIDVRMPGLDGLEICERVRARTPAARTRVVLLSAYMDEFVVERARVAGADAYMSKASSRNEICTEAIRVVRGLD